jgi:acetoin utilization deacetylase AcuC-like enzyme
MESIKEEKAKEWLKEEAQRFFDPNGAPEYYERLAETMEQIMEAGKQEREREIVEQIKNQLETMEELPFHSKDFLDGLEQAIYIIAPIKLDDTELKNLSK